MPKTPKPYRKYWRQVSWSESSFAGRQKVEAVLKGSIWKEGRRVAACRTQLAHDLEVPSSWVLLTNSCTSALAAAQRFTGGPHTFPVLTYAATFAYPLMMGEHVDLVDVTEDGWANIGESEHLSTCVDLWGRACPIASKCPPKVLDAAHRYNAPEHRELLEAGTAICYSFGPQKEVAAPDGGALVWRRLENEEFRARAYAFLHYGQVGGVPTGEGGISGFMREDTAAMVLSQLRRQWTQRRQRQAILETYHNYLGRYLMTKPGEASGHIAVLRLTDAGWKKRTMRRLAAMEAGHSLHYPVGDSDRWPVAKELTTRLLTVPCHTKMNPTHAARVAKVIMAE